MELHCYCVRRTVVRLPNFVRKLRSIFDFKDRKMFKYYTLQIFKGVLRVFPVISKRAVRITEKPNTSQRERLCMLWGNPVIFTDSREIL
jgi:hypothetical protein